MFKHALLVQVAVVDAALMLMQSLQGKLDAPNMVECNIRKNETNTYVDFHERYRQEKF